MAADPYATLGVKTDATQADIQKAYRRLAKKLHPDLNPGNTAAEDKFKELSTAYTLLSDAEKRARFDRGEIDASGTEQQPRQYYRDFADRGGSSSYSNGAGFGDFSDFAGSDDLLSEILGRAGRTTRRARGADVRYRLELDFLDAVNGGKQSVVLSDGTELGVNIPPGTRDGQILRLKEKGRRGSADGRPGDALIEISVRPHPYFIRKGDDIHIEVPISLKEGVLGAKIKIPTVSGAVAVAVPKWSSSGRILRIKGRGVPRAAGGSGDQYATLKLVLPKKPDPDLQRFASDWQPSDNPRQAMRV